MKREFLINISFLLAANLLIKPFYLFGIDRTVQNTVPDGDYGLYFALFNFTFLFQIVSDFGIQNYNNRNIAQSRQLLDKYFPSLLLLKGVLAALYLGLVLATAWLAGYQAAFFPLLSVIAVNQLLNSLLLFLRSNVSGLGLYRLDSLLSITDRLLLILICSVLLWAPAFQGRFQITWFAWAHTAALSIASLIAFGIVRRRLKAWRPSFRLPFLMLLLKRTAPYALAVFLMSVYNRIDGVMIERMLEEGQLEADIYASAYRLFEAGNVIGFLFAGLLLPIFSRMMKQGEAPDGLVRMSFQLILAGALSLFLGLAFFRTEVMMTLYDSGSAYSGQIMFYLMASFVAVCGTYIIGTLLVASGHLRQLNFIFGASLLLNVGLNLLLIPRLRAEGAALATLATQLLVLVAEILLSRRQLGLRLGWALVGRLLLFCGLALPAHWAIRELAPVAWYWQLLCCLAISGLLALVLKLASLGNLKQLATK